MRRRRAECKREARPRGAALGLFALAALAAAEARAHPHVFVDGKVDFLFAGGRLEAIRVTWVYDAFASLFMLEELGLDADGDGALTEAEKAAIVRDQTEWPEDFEGDSYLSVAGAEAVLGRPRAAEAGLVEGRVVVRFERALAEPAPAEGLEAVARLYDPTYFFAYFVEEAPRIEGAPGNCAAHVDPFEADEELAGLQETLAALSREETPERENVGALFADRIVLSCG
jgi:polyphosphate kinase